MNSFDNPFTTDEKDPLINPFDSKPSTTNGYGSNGFENKQPGSDKFEPVRKEIKEVKNGVLINIDKAINRDSKINTLVDKTEDLHTNAFVFRGKSKKLRRQMYCDYLKKKAMLIGIVLLVIFIIIMIIIGQTTHFK